MDYCCLESTWPSEDRSPWTLRCGSNREKPFNIDRRFIVVGADGGKARLLVKAPRIPSAIAAAYIKTHSALYAASSVDREPPSQDAVTMNTSSSDEADQVTDLSSLCSSCFDGDGFGKGTFNSGRVETNTLMADVKEHWRSRAPPIRSANTIKSLRGNLSVVLSAIYCIFLVTVGVVIGVADLIVPETNIGEIFSVCLLTPGLAWYVVLHVDLLKHRRKTVELNEFCQLRKTSVSGDTAGNRDQRKRSPSVPANGYSFHRGRHSGSFFLKIGAAGFCFGHLIHSYLMLGRQILHFTSPDPAIRRDCADVTALILHLVLPVYSFYQLFIIFKYSNVMINRWNELARFGLMHSMATSLFFWFWSVRNETVDSLHHHQLLRNSVHQHSNAVPMTSAAHDDDDDVDVYSNPAVPYLMNLTGGPKASEYGHDLMRMLWSNAVLSAERCAGGSDFSALILHVSPYLYPFSIEYSISMVGIWFIMWQNVGKAGSEACSVRGNPPESERGGDRSKPGENDNVDYGAGKRLPLLSSNHMVIHADCSSSNRGFFAGMIVMVATAVSIIVFFLAFSDHRYVVTGIWIGLVSESSLLLVMIVATVFAYRQLNRLDVNPNPVSQLDDLLLFVCIPSFFLYGIFSIVPAIVYRNYMSLIVVILQVGQVILQTPLIINGLRRCSTSADKAGRELVTFLIVCNMSMWIMETFEIKSYETNRDRVHFYGHQLWTLLSHVTLPLTLFYRFHSASCLVDIWKSAYEPPDDDETGDTDVQENV